VDFLTEKTGFVGMEGCFIH